MRTAECPIFRDLKNTCIEDPKKKKKKNKSNDKKKKQMMIKMMNDGGCFICVLSHHCSMCHLVEAIKTAGWRLFTTTEFFGTQIKLQNLEGQQGGYCKSNRCWWIPILHLQNQAKIIQPIHNRMKTLVMVSKISYAYPLLLGQWGRWSKLTLCRIPSCLDYIGGDYTTQLKGCYNKPLL